MMNYEKIFNEIVEKTKDYVLSNNIKAMVLGISGGIDSTIVAAICREVSDQTGIPLIGRSLTIVNERDEFSIAKKVGDAFCNDFKEVYLWNDYDAISGSFSLKEADLKSTPISEGNIMARLRMMYLYNLAGLSKGIVMDTDNLTEHYLGFWTIHGDEGDFNPIGGLWKSEIYELSKWLRNVFDEKILSSPDVIPDPIYSLRFTALTLSIDATPTDGNGISSSDLEQIGGKDYYEVDKILIPLVESDDKEKDFVKTDLILSGFDKDVVEKIYNRYVSSEFKRRTSRTIKIGRDELSIF